MDSDWIDVSVPIRTGMVHWPGNPPVVIERTLAMERGDNANISRISMGTHTGTHMDAPIHFLEGGNSQDVDHAAVGAQLRDLVFTDILAL
jgi:arylformamidase